MYELTLPFLGTISLWPYVIAAVVLLLVWDHLPTLFKSAISFVGSILGKLFVSGVKKVADPATVATVKTDVETSLAALQNMTVWAVKEGGPEVLSKITSLYHDLQAELQNNPRGTPKQ